MSLDVSIITTPDKSLNVDKDLQLIKLGLLYADQVTLCSANMSALLMMVRLGTFSEQEELDFLKSIVSKINHEISQEKIEEIIRIRSMLRKKQRKTRQEIIALGKMEAMIRQLHVKLDEIAKRTYSEYGLDRFIKLIENGTLKLNLLDMSIGGKQYAEKMLEETNRILNDVNTYPLFDDGIESLAHYYTQETQSSNSFANSKEMQVGKELFFNLPNLDNLTFEEIVSLKGELVAELARFKGLIMEYSNEIKDIPYSPETKVQIEKQYENIVKPQLAELQQMIDGNKFVLHLISDVKENISKYSLVLGITSIVALEQTLLGIGGIGTVGAESFFKARRKTLAQEELIKKNGLYFYHKIATL